MGGFPPFISEKQPVDGITLVLLILSVMGNLEEFYHNFRTLMPNKIPTRFIYKSEWRMFLFQRGPKNIGVSDRFRQMVRCVLVPSQ